MNDFMAGSVECARIYRILSALIYKRDPRSLDFKDKVSLSFCVEGDFFVIDLKLKRVDTEGFDGISTFNCTFKGALVLDPDTEYSIGDKEAHRVGNIIRKLVVRRFAKCVTTEQLPQYSCSTTKELSLLKELSIEALKGTIILKQ
jgi:hypothetical protein